ncbi:MAG: hypothetical protein H0T73_21960 [Ardenticatenales bacterium]|nr:hypothetical protein [Ardenticatenales bacterium]
MAEARSDILAIPLCAGEGEIRLLYEDGGRGEARPGSLEPTTFANGIRLLGYAVRGTPAPGETIRLFLRWNLIEPPAPLQSPA